jgi:exodeoxyribonuclease V
LRHEESGAALACEAHRHAFEGRELDYFERLRAQEFDYGYALTCHKAQGSQWPSVIVFDESGCFRKDRKRWLYTAVTRAADRVTLVQGM